MSSTLQSLAVHADAAKFSAEFPRRRSDKALEAYLSLDPENRTPPPRAACTLDV